MPVRQVQAHEAPWRGVREVRHRSHVGQGASRAHGPHRTGQPHRAHLVFEIAAVPHRPDVGHDAARHRAHPVLRSLCGDRSGPDPARARPDADRRPVPHRGRGTWRRIRRAHGCRGGLRAPEVIGPQRRNGAPQGRNRGHQFRDQAEAPHQAHQAGRGVPQFRQPSGMDGDDRAASAAAGPASAGAAGRRPLRDLRSQRPVPPRHQPQQPPEAVAGTQCARHHRAQREAHAAGIRRCAARQRPSWPCDHRHQQARAEVAGRHDQGQAGPVPPEPARQARGLLRPFGDHRRSDAQAAPVRPAQEDGAGTLQALHLLQAAVARHCADDQGGQEVGRARRAGGVGHSRRGDSRASGVAQPCPDPAPPRHPGVRAEADRGQGHPVASSGLHRVQRRLRRRPDGRARAAVAGSAARGARTDDVHQQHPVARQRRADHRADPGRGAGSVLHDPRTGRRQGRGHGLRGRGRGASRV